MAAMLLAAICVISTSVAAQDAAGKTAGGFPPERFTADAAIYANNCAPCHAAQIKDPESAFNLRKFPPDRRERFNTSVTRGKNQMPQRGDMLQPGDLDSLCAYVMAGDR